MKKIPASSGIYCYENLVNGKKYIGRAVNLRKRYWDHESNFNKDNYDDLTKTENEPLWNAVKKHGRNNFIFYILKECDKETLSENEIYYIEKLNSHVSKNGYNIAFGGISPMEGRNHTQESKDKIRNKKLGQSHSEKTILLLRKLFSGKNNPNYGKSISNTQKDKMRISMLRRFDGENNPSFGKKIGNPTSVYFGVWLNKVKRNDKEYSYWLAGLRLNKKLINLKRHPTEKDAAKAYDKYVIENNLPNPLNFPRILYFIKFEFIFNFLNFIYRKRKIQ